MSAEAVVKYLLGAADGVTAIVAARIYPRVAPLSTALPNVAFWQVSSTRINRLEATQTTHLTRSRVQVDLTARDYPGLKALRAAIIAALEFSRGTIAGSLVHMVELAGEGPDDYDAAAELYSQSVDFFVVYEST